MSRSKRPRKAYRPRLPAIPVMPELLREFEHLRIKLAWMIDSGRVTDSNALDDFARVFNVLNTAHPELLEGPVMAGFQRTLQSLIDRFMAAGAVTLNRFDAATLIAGFNRMIEVLPHADVSRMYVAMQKIRALGRAA
ncbi:MAG TPA: hypothetical protein PK177_13965 [Burkholderiaceae bacterium]|nr:hypothetical protein [Burkholderiaceae bacterium]